MARITIAKTREDRTCAKCGGPIPKGTQYRHATPGFRGRKIIRCMSPTCGFRTSDLVTSNMQGAYLAQEGFEDDIASATSLDDVTGMLETFADGLREVASLYEEASQNWGDYGNEEWDEKAQMLNDAADELTEFEWDAPECETCGGSGEHPAAGFDVPYDTPCPDCKGEVVGLIPSGDLTKDQIADLIQAAEEHAGNIDFE